MSQRRLLNIVIAVVLLEGAYGREADKVEVCLHIAQTIGP